MKKAIIVLIFFFAIQSCEINKLPFFQPKINKSILRLTEDGLPVYIVLNMLKKNGETSKLLLTNMEFHWQEYRALTLEKEYVDTLKGILNQKEWTPIHSDPKDYEKFKVNPLLLKKLDGVPTSYVYNKYFNTNGSPKEEFSEEEVVAAVVFLIEKGIVVQQGKYSMYNVYVPPKNNP